MTKSPLTVSLLLACTGGSGRLRLSGIFRYIHERAPNWTTVVRPFDSSALPAAGYIVDGLHAGEFASIARERVPVVTLDVEKGVTYRIVGMICFASTPYTYVS